MSCYMVLFSLFGKKPGRGLLMVEPAGQCVISGQIRWLRDTTARDAFL